MVKPKKQLTTVKGNLNLLCTQCFVSRPYRPNVTQIKLPQDALLCGVTERFCEENEVELFWKVNKIVVYVMLIL